ncbi:MAG: hypothetical protein QME64_11980 [bacterium]|nr:hypothetical protein [bacterium]
MKYLYRFLGWLFFSSLVFPFLSSSVLALPIDFDWSTRPVALRLNSAELKGVEAPKFVSAGKPNSITLSPDRTVITTNLAQSMLGYDYALRVQGEKLTLTVNGKLIESDPVNGPDGNYFCIFKQYLQPGENQIILSNEKGTAPLVNSAEMFALLFSNEEVHFARVFGKTPPIVMAQPPAETNQLKFDVLHYDLDHKITMTSSIITAQLMMIAKCIDTTLSFRTAVLDLDDNAGSFSVRSVDRGPGTATTAYTHNSTLNRLFIPLPAPLPLNSIFTVRVFYSGTPNPTPAFGSIAPYNRSTHGSPVVSIVYSFSEPYGARQWWPCKDVPMIKRPQICIGVVRPHTLQFRMENWFPLPPAVQIILLIILKPIR